jgi:hypothetical protein
VALNLDAGTANIAWKTKGAAAGVWVGREFALLHCTKNANLRAGDTLPPGKVNAGPAVEIEGTVFLEATANEFDIGTFEFGMVQISFIHTYRFLYVGRVDSEGSTAIDIRQGFTDNPSLDVLPATGETIDEHIFSPTNQTVDRVARGRKGFNVKVTFTDHPNNSIPRSAGFRKFLYTDNGSDFTSRHLPGALFQKGNPSERLRRFLMSTQQRSIDWPRFGSGDLLDSRLCGVILRPSLNLFAIFGIFLLALPKR